MRSDIKNIVLNFWEKQRKTFEKALCVVRVKNFERFAFYTNTFTYNDNLHFIFMTIYLHVFMQLSPSCSYFSSQLPSILFMFV